MSLNDFYITPNTMTRPLPGPQPRLGSTPLAVAYLFECILKILKLDNCIAVAVAVMVHDPVAGKSGVHMRIAVTKL